MRSRKNWRSGARSPEGSGVSAIAPAKEHYERGFHKLFAQG